MPCLSIFGGSSIYLLSDSDDTFPLVVLALPCDSCTMKQATNRGMSKRQLPNLRALINSSKTHNQTACFLVPFIFLWWLHNLLCRASSESRDGDSTCGALPDGTPQAEGQIQMDDYQQVFVEV
jgi:hypothetical protein